VPPRATHQTAHSSERQERPDAEAGQIQIGQHRLVGGGQCQRGEAERHQLVVIRHQSLLAADNFDCHGEGEEREHGHTGDAQHDLWREPDARGQPDRQADGQRETDIAAHLKPGHPSAQQTHLGLDAALERRAMGLAPLV
jgi:hypothetical protein